MRHLLRTAPFDRSLTHRLPFPACAQVVVRQLAAWQAEALDFAARARASAANATAAHHGAAPAAAAASAASVPARASPSVLFHVADEAAIYESLSFSHPDGSGKGRGRSVARTAAAARRPSLPSTRTPCHSPPPEPLAAPRSSHAIRPSGHRSPLARAKQALIASRCNRLATGIGPVPLIAASLGANGGPEAGLDVYNASDKTPLWTTAGKGFIR